MLIFVSSSLGSQEIFGSHTKDNLCVAFCLHILIHISKLRNNKRVFMHLDLHLVCYNMCI